MIFYYLFYTGTIQKAAYETPTLDSTPLRSWEPRILSYPSFLQSFKNIQTGIFTIADSDLEIANADDDFQQYQTDDDSFANKEVSIWLCINSTANIQRAFLGYCTSIKWNRESVRISISDSFSKLKNTAFMGDLDSEAILSLSSFPNLDPNANNVPCPYVFGRSSAYKSTIWDTYSHPDSRFLVSGFPARCIDFGEYASNTLNRQWLLCRTDDVIPTQVFGTVISTVTAIESSVTFSSVSGVFIGDTFSWTDPSGPHTYYCIVTRVVGSVVYFLPPLGPGPMFIPIAFNLSSTMNPKPSMAVLIKNPADSDGFYTALYGRDYSLSTTTTSSGNKLHKITFVNGFESGFEFGLVMTNLNPATMSVHFRISHNDQGISYNLRKMLSKAGFTSIQSSSFEIFDDSLALVTRFHIPNIDEDNYNDYLKYFEDFLSACLGYIYINSSFSVAGNVLTIPDSTSVRDSTLILDGSSNGEFEYQDIATQIIPYNPHADDNDNGNEISVKSDKAKYLHGIVNTNRFKHPFENLTDRIDAHMSLKSNRNATYNFEVATEDIDSSLGDDILLDNNIVPIGSRSAKIISLEKSPGKILVEASDLLGIPDIEA